MYSLTFIHCDVSVTQLDQWSETTGRVYNLVTLYWSHESLSQVLEGYRCRVDKKWIQRALSLVTDMAPARPTDWPLSRCSWWLTSPPLTHCDLTTMVESTYSGYGGSQLDSLVRRPACGFAYQPSSNDRNDNSLKFSTVRNTILVYQDIFSFFESLCWSIKHSSLIN